MKKIRVKNKNKIAIVFSGGVVKAAAFHIGVVSALRDFGITFKGGIKKTEDQPDTTAGENEISVYVGSSAGSLVSSFLAQGGEIDDLINIFNKNIKDSNIPNLKLWELVHPRALGQLKFLFPKEFIFKFLKDKTIQSPFGTQGIVKYLKNHIVKTSDFSKIDSELYIVTTDLNSDKKIICGSKELKSNNLCNIYRTDISLLDAAAASMSLPPLYHPFRVKVGDEILDLYDGELKQPLNEHVAIEAGADLIICSYTHQPLNVLKNSKSLSSEGIHNISLQAFYQMFEGKIKDAQDSRLKEKLLLADVKDFFEQNNLDQELAEELMKSLEKRMNYRRNLDFIFIHPDPTDIKMFQAPNFSLNKKKMNDVLKNGYDRAKKILQENLEIN